MEWKTASCPTAQTRSQGNWSRMTKISASWYMQKTRALLERFSMFCVMIKMRRVFEIKFRDRRRAGPQRRLMSGTQSVSRFLMQYVAGRLDLRASIWSINNWHNSCKLHARVVRLAIELEQMERKCWAWREYNHQGEGWRRRRYIASRMFNILCRESSGLLFDGGKNTLVRVTRRTRPRIVSLSPKIRVISQIPHLPLTVPAKQKQPVPFAGRWPVKSGLVVPCLGVEFLFQSLGFHSIYVWDFWALQLMRERGCDC